VKMLIKEMPWHVLQVRSNYEKRVANLLTVREIESYVPFYRERTRWTDRTVMTERPLFSGYVFAQLPSRSRTTALTTPGVVRWLGDEERNLVSHAELDEIRKGLASEKMLRPHRGVAKGTWVRVRRGLFEGYEGIVEEFRQNCTLILTLAAVQRSISLQVGCEEIEIVGNPPRHAQSQAQVYGAA